MNLFMRSKTELIKKNVGVIGWLMFVFVAVKWSGVYKV